ncbi:MAG: hypothetical protein JEZ00_20225 [Anaerolineaceae bacterium]|nr:hypothetical protein [Anaerolineaceae bacterium]
MVAPTIGAGSTYTEERHAMPAILCAVDDADLMDTLYMRWEGCIIVYDGGCGQVIVGGGAGLRPAPTGNNYLGCLCCLVTGAKGFEIDLQ